MAAHRLTRLPRAAITVVAALVLSALFATSAPAAAPAWTTYRHDAARSGVDPDSTNPVTPAQAWQSTALDGEVYGQPLVVGTSVFVATENDTVYRLDAGTGAVVWSRHLATPEPASAAPCGDIAPTIGITSTPVIDPATNRIYAVGAVSSGGTIRHELFALDLGTGQLAAGFPIGVDPSYPSGGSAVNQLQRSGLALDGGRVLIGYGGNDGDCATYWGWLVSAPTDGSTALHTFQADPSYREGAIWAAGNAPPVDSAGHAFLATGNGTSSNASDPNYGDAVVKLDFDATALDWWAPTNWKSLDSSDADLGSSMPTLLPNGYLFQTGKDGNGYLLNGGSLGHVSAPAATVSGVCSGGSFGGSVFDPADATLYVACSGGDGAVAVGSGSPPSLAKRTGFSAPSGATGPPMVAGGLVWTVSHSGTLYGLDPGSGASRAQFVLPESGPSGTSFDTNHFATPSAGGGRLFVASGDQVTAVTIAQPPGAAATTTSLAAAPHPATAGATVTLTATVSPVPDGGAVTITDGGAAVPGCANLPVSTANGQATCTASFATAGTHDLAATYSGDSDFAGSASPLLPESVAAGAHTSPVVSRPGPAITHVSVRPRRFRPARGTRVRLTLSEAATVRVVITQVVRGRRVARRCRVGARHGRVCLARVTRARRHIVLRAGRRTFVVRLRGLRRGRYRLSLTAVDRVGHRSRTVSFAITVL